MKFIVKLLASYSLKGKMRIILGSIFFTTVTCIIVSIFLGKAISDRYQRSINFYYQIKEDLAHLQIQMLELTRVESEYMASKDAIYLDFMTESHGKFDEALKKIDERGKDILDRTIIESIDQGIDSYITAFNNLVELVSKEGSNNRVGLIGELTRLQDQIESEISELEDKNKFKIALYAKNFLTESRSYLSTWKIGQIGETKNALFDYKNLTKNSNTSLTGNLSELIEKYMAKLVQVYENHENLVSSKNNLQKFIVQTEENIHKGIESANVQIQEYMNSTKKLENVVKYINGFVIIVSLFIMFVALLVVNRTTKIFSDISDRIKLSSHDTQKSSITLKNTAGQVSKAATEQASAIQETVATLNEITAMVNKSVENAHSSAEKANLSHQITTEGREAVIQMRDTMDEIQNFITQMMNRVEEGNEQIEGIVKIIGEISNKTTIINDIVFQTKLLSFNASVEAARAGDHGKGFAVVAEEVGNLARMSGNASKEISELLRTSRENVVEIVKNSKENMGKLVQEASNKVTGGVAMANRCDEILGEVVDHVSHVKELMNEISTASKEQAEGVHNISIAMNELDATTHSNSDMAQETSECSNLLSEQSDSLGQAVLDLQSEILGNDETGRRVTEDTEEESSFNLKNVLDLFSRKNKDKELANDTSDFEESGDEDHNESVPSNVHKISGNEADEEDEDTQSLSMKKASGFEDVPSSENPNFKE